MEGKNWSYIVGYDKRYLINEEGKILDCGGAFPREVEPVCVNERYVVSLQQKNGTEKQYDLAVLVASYFLPNPMRLENVMFLDNDFKNCCADNLQWEEQEVIKEAENAEAVEQEPLRESEKSDTDNTVQEETPKLSLPKPEGKNSLQALYDALEMDYIPSEDSEPVEDTFSTEQPERLTETSEKKETVSEKTETSIQKNIKPEIVQEHTAPSNHLIENRNIAASVQVSQKELKEEKFKGTPIVQYDANGVFMKKWSSPLLAASETGIPYLSILEACRKGCGRAGKYYWEYYTSVRQAAVVPSNPAIPDKWKTVAPKTEEEKAPAVVGVGQYSGTGKLLGQWRTALEAEKDTGVSYMSILDCLCGLAKSAGGFIWKQKGFVEKEEPENTVAESASESLTVSDRVEDAESTEPETTEESVEVIEDKIMEPVETKPPADANSEQSEQSASGSDRINIRNQLLYQYDRDGHFIRTWKNVGEASVSEDIRYNSIYACLRGERYTAGGYRWLAGADIDITEVLPPIERKSIEYKNFPQCQTQAILQYDKEGKFLREWTNVREAAMFYKCNEESIKKCCRGKQWSTRDGIWRYKESEDYPMLLPVEELPKAKDTLNQNGYVRGTPKKVLQFTMNNEFIREWNSVGEAEAAHGFGISACCRGDKPSVGGYKWYYKGLTESTDIDKASVSASGSGKIPQETETKPATASVASAKEPESAPQEKNTLTMAQQILASIKAIQNKQSVQLSPTENPVQTTAVKDSPKDSRAVVCSTLDGKIIAKYTSIQEAVKALQAEGITRDIYHGIYRCCCGKQLTAYKYRWYFEGGTPAVKKKTKAKRLYQYDSESHTLIKKWKSASAVASYFRVSTSTVRTWCKGKGNSGHLWFYEDEIPGDFQR